MLEAVRRAKRRRLTVHKLDEMYWSKFDFFRSMHAEVIAMIALKYSWLFGVTGSLAYVLYRIRCFAILVSTITKVHAEAMAF